MTAPMAEYRLFGNIVHLGPHEFHVFASAVAEEVGTDAIVINGRTESRLAAEALLESLLIQVGQRVRLRGNTVIDIVA